MPTNTSLIDLSAACEQVARDATASVVQVHGRRRPASGVVIAPERVVTTSHSVEWEDHTRVRTADGRLLPAQVAGRDAQLDLVLLRVPTLEGHALTVSDGAPSTGTLGLVVGRTWSGHLRARLTTITALEGSVRVGRGTRLDRALGLDVGVYPGFSGSAVLLADGRLVGLATAGLVRATALALPAGHVRQVLDGIERHGSVKRGFLGITSQPVQIPERQRNGRAEADGLLVTGVAAGTPAEQAGLLVGDIVVGFAGTPVDEPESLLALLTGDRVGHATPVAVLRGGRGLDVSVTVGQRSDKE
jgi:S1-C subfamily serine protease